jgi:hypothetical protein
MTRQPPAHLGCPTAAGHPDIEANAKEALIPIDLTLYFVKYGKNVWAAVKGYLQVVTDRAAAPVIAKYTGVLASRT